MSWSERLARGVAHVRAHPEGAWAWLREKAGSHGAAIGLVVLGGLLLTSLAAWGFGCYATQGYVGARLSAQATDSFSHPAICARTGRLDFVQAPKAFTQWPVIRDDDGQPREYWPRAFRQGQIIPAKPGWLAFEPAPEPTPTLGPSRPTPTPALALPTPRVRFAPGG